MCRKNIVSKIILLCLISVMIFQNFVIKVNAAGGLEPERGSITVNKLEPGVTLHLYWIMDENFDNRTNQPSEPQHIWAEEFASWISNNYPEYIDVNNLNAVTKAFSQANDIKIAEFYDKLSVAIKSGEVEAEVEDFTAESDVWSIDGIPAGNYLILVENGARVYRPLTANVMHEWEDSSWTLVSANVDAKSTEPTITKTISDKKKDNADIGDTVKFELNAVIPTYPENAISQKIVVSDKLPESLTLVEDSIKAYGVNAATDPVLLENAFTKAKERPTGTDNEKETSFSLTFEYNKVSAYTAILVTYETILNERANIGESGNINYAYLDYNNNPYVENTWKTDDDSANVYTYAMNVTKVDGETDAPLSGAQFTLSKDETEVMFVFENDKYRVAKAGEEATNTLEVNEQGLLLMEGLDAGTYKLTETVAPDEYMKLQNPIEIIIADEDLDGKVEADGKELESGTMPVTVKNEKGFTLPTTGGAGTLLFNMVGVIMMGAGVVLILIFMSKKKNER